MSKPAQPQLADRPPTTHSHAARPRPSSMRLPPITTLSACHLAFMVMVAMYLCAFHAASEEAVWTILAAAFIAELMPRRLRQRFGNPRQIAQIRIAGENRRGSEILLDTVQPRRDHRRQREIGVHIATGEPVLHPQRGPVAEHAEGAGPVIHPPGECGRRSACRN